MENSTISGKRIEPFSKVRRIKITQSSDRGIIFTEKNLLDGFIEFESLLEEGFFKQLIHDPHCIDLESQPIRIPNKNNSEITYVPDVWAKFKDGTQYIYDVKHQEFLDSLESNSEKAKKWKVRTETMKNFCNERDLHYEIVTDNEIFNERLNNIKFFEKNKRVPEIFPKVKPLIEEILKRSGELSRITLALNVAEKLQLNLLDVIPTIDYLIYNDFFSLDLESKIDDETIIHLKTDEKSKILPLYAYFSKIKEIKINSPPKSFKVDSKDPNYDSTSQREFMNLETPIRQEILNRIKLLKIFDQNSITTEKIKEHAQKNDLTHQTLYRWKKKYDQHGWVGLIPNYNGRGRKKGINEELEELMQKVIEEKYLTNLQPSILGCYRFLEIECEKKGIEKPSLNTFRARVNEISNVKKTYKRKGKKLLRDKFNLLDGEYPFGEYPLDLVEFDHTILDIMLVDRFDRKPIGRPTLTIGIDVYSRMVYGYYLSFDAPNVLAIGMCFLNGILSKDKITTYFETAYSWSIQGLPRNILIDNAKEFRSGAFFNFCQLYGITIRFNPVRRPDLKPHVERLIRTINEAIRDDLMGGYIQPLNEKKQTGYDPEKSAIMTIEEFEKWFVHWIVDDYQQKSHLGIETTPFEKFQEGLSGTNGRIVGTPNRPLNLEQLQFDVLPFERRTLQRDGIELFGLNYHHPIIAKLRAAQHSQDEKYIVKYDPRDIREVYLWVDSEGKYYPIPIRKGNLSQLMVNPNDPSDFPLSLKEFESIKRNRQGKEKKMPISSHKLAESREKRQKLIEESHNKTVKAKRGRKEKEKTQLYKKTATSTNIRKPENQKNETDFQKEDLADETEINEDWLRANAYPSKQRWNEGDF